MNRLLITTLAEYQTRFWLKVGLQLCDRGVPVEFLSFDDRSTEMLRAAGLMAHSATSKEEIPADDVALDEVFNRFSIDQLNFWTAHERFAFGVRNTQAMRRKLARSLIAAEVACRACAKAGGETRMVQELGGFLSVIGSFFAARRHGIDNLFIEPSFFRGRIFFLRNTFAAMQIQRTAGRSVSDEVARYLDDTLKGDTIVVPLKDKHQYTTARKKIVNWKNARRLLEKILDKHLCGKSQEFGHIGHHVAMHSRMLFNSYRLRNAYTPLEQCGRYVYYPLHVPGDMALTLRSPHLLDQLTLIDYLCRSVPATHRVVVKEHPAMVGAVDAERAVELLRRYDNLLMLPPSTNNYKVLRMADAIVSVNSKSGAEAGLIGKPVLTLGDAFYRDAPFSTAVDRLQDLPECIGNLLGSGGRPPPHPDDVRRYFSDVWDQTLPGELYVSDDANVARFVDSLLAAIVR
jgi:hypothetical protein